MSEKIIRIKSGNEETTMNVTEEEYLKYYRPWWQMKKKEQRNREAMEQNGYTEESYETGRYEGSIPDGHKLVIDTTQISYSITERGVSDEVVADRYQMCDFTTERFFHLQYGSNRISVVHEGLNILNVMVEGRISYETI